MDCWRLAEGLPGGNSSRETGCLGARHEAKRDWGTNTAASLCSHPRSSYGLPPDDASEQGNLGNEVRAQSNRQWVWSVLWAWEGDEMTKRKKKKKTKSSKADSSVCFTYSCLVAKSCPIFFFFFATPKDYSPPGASVHGISQARILEWIAISFSRGPSRPRGGAGASCSPRGFFTTAPPRKTVSVSFNSPSTL